MNNFFDWVKGGWSKTSPESGTIQFPKNMPRHIAVIMDGNGRWAKARNFPRFRGHQAGREALWEIVRASGEWGIQYLTVYAFSTENWRRPKEEIDLLMTLLSETIDDKLPELQENNVRLHFLGRLEQLPLELQKKCAQAEQRLSKNNGLNLQVMLSYGSRAEMVDAFRKIAVEILQGKKNPADINEKDIQDALYTAGIPDPDLLIRTAAEYRLSNFMLWQSAYTEIWVTPTFWPDFGREELLQAILEYSKRERRFGKVDR